MSIPGSLILSMTAALGGTICKKYYTDRSSAGVFGGFVFNLVGCLTAAAILLCWGGIGTPSVFTVWLGIGFGAVTALQAIANVAALQVGPMSYTSVIISFSTVISALSGVVFFDERLGLAQVVGIVLMLASFLLATERMDGERKQVNLKWIGLCLIAFLANGCIGIMQKIHQSSAYRDELNAFLVIAFASSTCLCAIVTVILHLQRTRGAARDVRRSRRQWLLLGIMVLSGICIAVNNQLNLYLSGIMESAVFFPIVNGGGLVLSTLAALLLFRERLTRRQWFGIAFGIVSVVFLCNPFA